jgi:uroporphyrinogen decarboxylase
LWAPIFHNLTWICGFENTLVNLKLEPEISKALIRHVTDFWIDYTRKLLECGKGRIDIVQNCNDFGAQNGLLIGIDTFREFFKPELKRLYDAIKEYGAKVMQHSCGAIEPIIPDLIEIGMDILNPVQVSATDMEMEVLAEKYGNNVTFYGGIDTQHVLPEGPIDRIRLETRRAIGTLGRGGGYILSPSQAFEPDIPVNHLLAMFDEGFHYNLDAFADR